VGVEEKLSTFSGAGLPKIKGREEERCDMKLSESQRRAARACGKIAECIDAVQAIGDDPDLSSFIEENCERMGALVGAIHAWARLPIGELTGAVRAAAELPFHEVHNILRHHEEEKVLRKMLEPGFTPNRVEELLVPNWFGLEHLSEFAGREVTVEELDKFKHDGGLDALADAVSDLTREHIAGFFKSP
jgi:hypothetical protein